MAKAARNKKRVTIMDVAKEAGVSIAAVSRILNNSYDGFSAREETKQRVYAAVKKLGYKANRSAVRLATGRHQAIGLCYPEEAGDAESLDASSLAATFGRLGQMLMVRGAARAAAKARHDLVIMVRSQDRPLDEVLAQSGETVDGVVYLAPGDDERELEKLEQSPTPIAVVGPLPRESGKVCCVQVDEFTAGRMAMGHLIVAGARRVVVAAPQESSRQTAIQRRLEGVKATVKNYSDPALGFDILDLPSDIDEAKAAFLNHVGRWGKPDGILTLGGILPFPILAALAEQGVRAPGDVKLAGFDENPMYQLHDPAITGIRYPVEEMTRRATEMLLERIRTGETPPPATLSPKMMARKSSEAPLRPLYS